MIAHEVGHHVQNLLGTMERVNAAQRQRGEAEANDLSVRLELQADFLAGVWAHTLSGKACWIQETLKKLLGAPAQLATTGSNANHKAT